MRYDRILRYIMDNTGKSMREISRIMGKGESWAKTTALPGRSPQLATVARVADLAGLDVALVDRGTGKVVATIDVPCREDSV